MQSNIDAEATIRAATDTALQAAIDTEATQRAAADTSLQAAIDTEATQRAAADTSLQAAIDTEATQRAAADSALQAAIEAYLQSELESMKTQIDAIISTGSGYTIDSEGTYHVYTKDGLLAWMSIVPSNVTVNCILESDIDMLSASLSPIGNSSTPYMGTFDGNGHTISNATINGDDSTNVGFFGFLYEATIRNLSLENISVNATSTGNLIRAGALAGYMSSGTLSNCSVSAMITGGHENGGSLGGIVGYLMASSTNYSTNIEGCSFSGTVTATHSYGIQYAGGIAGSVTGGIVTSCANNGTVSAYSANDHAYAGGIVGYTDYEGTKITSCSNSGVVSALSDVRGAYAGYIVGRKLNGTITSCTNTGSPSNQDGTTS